MSVTDMLDHVATLQRQAISQGGSGGQLPNVYTDDANAVNVGVNIQPANGGTVFRYAQRRMVVTHTLYFDDDWQARVGNRWVTDGGKVYKVKGWYNSLEHDDAWVCDCELIDVPGRTTEATT